MNISKTISKTSLVCAAAAALALVAGPVHAVTVSASFTVKLTGQNATKGCVRFYVNGQHDVAAGQTKYLGGVSNDTPFMASVFPGPTCGGTASRNVWITTNKWPSSQQAYSQTWKVQ
ncbi:hypothetical protein [Ralstonia solanacearum]|uniref:hypothetical protein n=1 Tax=Ralstonia solanacearum TaxID=305 RepID=UPI0006DC1440|nr:hypothetical protein [Ralstonia solanacearum]MCL9844318.1 hypothetical protein [Ralstonia solanacearum]MDC6253361.1 hypothetical protein [Ralstonia solanacearum]MDC6257765.1 hypothetical protein [Ralstonia solanacearum]MDC6305632.1 hypothetical protein [Ralstonia solanacearum]